MWCYICLYLHRCDICYETGLLSPPFTAALSASFIEVTFYKSSKYTPFVSRISPPMINKYSLECYLYFNHPFLWNSSFPTFFICFQNIYSSSNYSHNHHLHYTFAVFFVLLTKYSVKLFVSIFLSQELPATLTPSLEHFHPSHLHPLIRRKRDTVFVHDNTESQHDTDNL